MPLLHTKIGNYNAVATHSAKETSLNGLAIMLAKIVKRHKLFIDFYEDPQGCELELFLQGVGGSAATARLAGGSP